MTTVQQFGVVVTHTRMTDNIVNDALHIVSGCLLPTPTEDLPVLAGIQPAQLCQLGVTLFLANRAIHDADHVLHRQLVVQQDVHQRDLDLDADLYLLHENY